MTKVAVGKGQMDPLRRPPILSVALTVLLAMSLACATAPPPPDAPGALDTGQNVEGATEGSGDEVTDASREPGTESDPQDPDQQAQAPDLQTKDPDSAQPQAHSSGKGRLRRHAESGLEGMIIGTVIGGQLFGQYGALVGAVGIGLYGLITGDVPFDTGRGSSGRGGRSSRGDPDTALEDEIDEELDRQEELESEIEEELRRQEELLASINEQEEINESVRREELERVRAETPADALDAPPTPYERQIPESIFDTEKREEAGQERLVKSLDADRDGKPEIELVFDDRSGQILSRSEDTDYDGRLDAENRYEDGRISERVEDTNGDGAPDRWVSYKDGRGSGVKVDRNFDGLPDAEYVYEKGTLKFEEHDTNHDGKIDRRVEYRDRRRVIEIEDRNHDGKMDFRTFYNASEVPVRTEEDTNADGDTEIWEFYEGTDPAKIVLVRKEEDVDSDGKVDVTSYYEDGKLARKEIRDPDALD
jgi:antitoxin component YwqK of YwqJK toxin-antitoxin module